MDYFTLDPLPTERICEIWWDAGLQYPDHWRMVAHWLHGAYTVAQTADDRETYHLLMLVAWDHAGVRRPALEEVAA